MFYFYKSMWCQSEERNGTDIADYNFQSSRSLRLTIKADFMNFQTIRMIWMILQNSLTTKCLVETT